MAEDEDEGLIRMLDRRIGYWTKLDLERMDTEFCVAMRREHPGLAVTRSAPKVVLPPRRRDVPMETIEKYLHSLYRVQPDFVYSVSRDFAKSCQTPMLVLPDDVTAHPLQVSIDIASLVPNAEITVFP